MKVLDKETGLMTNVEVIGELRDFGDENFVGVAGIYLIEDQESDKYYYDGIAWHNTNSGRYLFLEESCGFHDGN